VHFYKAWRSEACGYRINREPTDPAVPPYYIQDVEQSYSVEVISLTNIDDVIRVMQLNSTFGGLAARVGG
jgi:hypothetical protein